MYKSLKTVIWITEMVSVEQQIILVVFYPVKCGVTLHQQIWQSYYEMTTEEWKSSNTLFSLTAMKEWIGMIALSNFCCVKSGDGREVNWRDFGSYYTSIL